MNCYPLPLLSCSPLPLLRLPPSATAQTAYSQINCYCCWLRVAVAGAYVAPPSPTNADGDGVSRRAQTRARIRSPFLSLFNSPSLFWSLPLSLCFFLPPTPHPTLSHSLSHVCPIIIIIVVFLGIAVTVRVAVTEWRCLLSIPPSPLPPSLPSPPPPPSTLSVPASVVCGLILLACGLALPIL